jgi:lysozyme family protein
MSHFDKAIKVILKNEGGLVNNPNDPGGLTNFGITLTFIRNHDIDVNGDGVIDENDIIDMTEEQATDIYQKYIWAPGNFDEINDYWVATKVFDMSVNMGEHRAGILTQSAANSLGAKLVADGALGPKSFEAINSFDPVDFLAELKKEQAGFYQRLVQKKPQLAEFLKGWLRRANWPV